MKRDYTKAIIRNNRLSVEGTSHVLIYYHKYQTKYFPTGVWAKPRYWSKSKQFVKDNCDTGDSEKMNEIIYILKKDLNIIIENYRA